MDLLIFLALALWPICGLAATAVFFKWFAGHCAAEREERQQWADRVQVPEVAHAAAFARAIPPAPPLPDTDAEDDLRFGRPLDAIEFLDPEPT